MVTNRGAVCFRSRRRVIASSREGRREVLGDVVEGEPGGRQVQQREEACLWPAKQRCTIGTPAVRSRSA
jgi:hypothetical protein